MRFRISFLILFSVALAACGGTSNAIDAGNATVDAQNLEPSKASPAALESYVRLLSEQKVPRNSTEVATLDEIAGYIKGELEGFGYTAEEQTFTVGADTYRNVSALVGPAGGKRVVVGAHYDAAGALPGADDNASGVAGLLEFARLLSNEDLTVQVEIVAFSLEEPPHFGSSNMGSARHAATVSSDDVQLMISLEMLGYYTDEPGSQSFPEIQGIPQEYLIGKYGDTGNFIAAVARPADQAYLTRIETEMNAASDLKAVTLAVPASVTGVAWSDHYNYWDRGIPAVMITDTAMYRNTAYHTAQDTWDRLDYGRMAKVVDGLRDAVVSLGSNPI